MKHALMLMGLMPLLFAGCTTRVIPPRVQGEMVKVYLTDYGRHSSILLPAPGGYNEYAYGDWNFFAMGNASTWNGVRALLHSDQATLGRRFVRVGPEGLSRETLDCERLMSFEASRARVEALELTLMSAFNRSRSPQRFSSYSSLYHIRDPEQYWLFNNCNHITARWLRQLGCRTVGSSITSKFYIEGG